MRKSSLLKIVALSSTLLSFAIFADDHHAPTPKFSQTLVKDNIHILQGKGGNIGVLTGDQGLLLIDDDYADMSPKLKAALLPFGGKEKVTYLINTHWHGDHTGGNALLGDYATIIAHDNVRKRLLSPQEIKLFGMKSEAYPNHALPSITFNDSMSLHINNEDLRLVHFANGHTDGDSVIFFNKANVLHTGDHFFNGFYPFVDVDSGGNVLTMADNVTKLLSMINDDTIIIPGHGPLGKKDDLVAFRDMLLGTSAEVKAMKDKGLSLKTIQQKGLSSQWQPWTKGFLNTDTWISIVYASL